MIKYRLSAYSHDRNQAIQYLLAKVKTETADGWEKVSDVSLVEKRERGASKFVATTTVVTDESRFAADQ